MPGKFTNKNLKVKFCLEIISIYISFIYYYDKCGFFHINYVTEWFQVNVGLRQGCVMSPWLFNVYMDGVVQGVNVRVLGKVLELLSANGGRFEINQQLFADDTALVTDSEEEMCRLVSEFGRVCERRKLS